MALRLGIDLSNFSGALTPERLDSVRKAGYDFAIVGAQTGLDGMNYTAQQIAACRAAGIEVLAVYELLYWDTRDDARMSHAASFGLPVWIDCEATVPAGMLPEQIVERIQRAQAILDKQFAGIYTGAWWWNPQTRSSIAFAGAPLWNANYLPLDQGPDSMAPVQYGGWRTPALWQYRDSVTIGDVLCDLNAMEAAPAPPLTTPQPVKGLLAAAFVASVGNPLSDLAPEDAAAVKAVAAQL